MANKVTSTQILHMMIMQMLDRKTSERRMSKQLNISRKVKRLRKLTDQHLTGLLPQVGGLFLSVQARPRTQTIC